jgi:HAE1 family hydrophobic/amphiphilic exporter-1
MQAAQDITVGAGLRTNIVYALRRISELNHWSALFLDKLKSIPGMAVVASDQQTAGALLDITIKRDVASSYGILPATIDNTLSDAFGQHIVSTMLTQQNQYHVVLEVEPQFQFGPNALSDIYVNSSSGQQVPRARHRQPKVEKRHSGQPKPPRHHFFNLLPGTRSAMR